MGSDRYDDTIYSARISTAKATGSDLYTHDADIRSGVSATTVHEKLDPKKLNTFGKRVRESFDSDVHPNSRAVAVLFDVTGSMSNVPRIFVEKLGKLMAMLVKKAYIENPHVLFGAIGDATSDQVPLQVGQFEGGNEIDEALTKIYLEGNGGGGHNESYELGMYFMARHADMHCLTKRNQKGFLFIIGDELPYRQVERGQVDRIIGDSIQENIPTEAILEELREKFEVFWIMPAGTSHADDNGVIEPLRKMFGQHFMRLENPGDVCELIASTIGVTEGFDINAIASDLKDVGADGPAIDRATKSVVKYAATRAVTKAAVASGELVPTGAADDVARL
jgi:hypothetical protein